MVIRIEIVALGDIVIKDTLHTPVDPSQYTHILHYTSKYGIDHTKFPKVDHHLIKNLSKLYETGDQDTSIPSDFDTRLKKFFNECVTMIHSVVTKNPVQIDENTLTISISISDKSDKYFDIIQKFGNEYPFNQSTIRTYGDTLCEDVHYSSTYDDVGHVNGYHAHLDIIDKMIRPTIHIRTSIFQAPILRSKINAEVHALKEMYEEELTDKISAVQKKYLIKTYTNIQVHTPVKNARQGHVDL